jgi:hypothetical protein
MALTTPDKQLPYLALQKEPALTMQELYIKYPDGGQFGWYAFVKEIGSFAYWDVESESWKGDRAAQVVLDAVAAKEAAEEAQVKAEAAETNAEAYKTQAQGYAQNAFSYKGLAEYAQGKAEEAQAKSEEAQVGAEGARDQLIGTIEDVEMLTKFTEDFLCADDGELITTDEYEFILAI